MKKNSTKLLALTLALIFICGCNQAKEADTIAITKKEAAKYQDYKEKDTPEGKKKPLLTWEVFNKYCSKNNGERVNNIKLLKDKKIHWKGTVANITDNSHYGGYIQKEVVIILSLEELSKLHLVGGDITLRVPDQADKRWEKIVDKLKKGDKVHFTGKIGYLSESIGHDSMIADGIGIYTPPEKKKAQPRKR